MVTTAPRPAPGKLAAILLIFVTIGPVVGTIVLGLLMALSAGSVAAVAATVFLGLVSGISHLIGAIPAAIAGLAVGVKQVSFGGTGWRFALVTGMLVGLTPLTVGRPATIRDLVGFMIITTLATLACWSIVCSWWLDRPGSAA
jgi:hypothetical protein